jgi:hypothetical protein
MMSALTRILSGLALAGALSVPTFAATSPRQGDSLPNGSMLIIRPDGTMANGKMMSDDMSDTSNPNVAADKQSQGAQPQGTTKQ